MATTTAPPVRLFLVLIRALATRGRVAALGLLGVGAIVLAVAVRAGNPTDRAKTAFDLVDGYGLALLVPVVALVFASAAFGDPAEDGTLVYVWLRPIPRWQLAVAAFAAAVCVTLPIAVAPIVVGAAVSGGGAKLAGAAAAGGVVATVAYSAVFCGIGLRVRRALAWGLTYLLIWEQAVARSSHGAARASLFVNARSLTAYLADQAPPKNAVAPVTGLIVPLVTAVVALVLTTRSLNRGDVA